MAKTKTRSSQPPNADNQHLDQTIEHLTEEVARTASRFRIPLILLVVAVIGGILITQLMGKIEDVQRQGTNDEIAAFFSGSTAEIRSGASRLLETVRSEKIEPFVVSRYALWLFVKNGDGDRQQALGLLESTFERHPDSLLLVPYIEEFRQAIESSAGFVLPEPEPIVIPEPPVVDPVTATDGEAATVTDPNEGTEEGATNASEEGTGEEASGNAAAAEGASGEEVSDDGAADEGATSNDAGEGESTTTDGATTEEATTGEEEAATGEGGDGR